jgi:hypothetical protein
MLKSMTSWQSIPVAAMSRDAGWLFVTGHSLSVRCQFAGKTGQ